MLDHEVLGKAFEKVLNVISHEQSDYKAILNAIYLSMVIFLLEISFPLSKQQRYTPDATVYPLSSFPSQATA